MNQTAKGAAEAEEYMRSCMRQMSDETLDRHVLSGDIDEIEREIARQEQRRRNELAKAIEVAEKARAAEEAREARTAARAAARASVAQEGTSAAQPPGTTLLRSNREHAERFASHLTNAGINAKARATQRIQGKEVLDGWTVNVRNDAHEIGMVAAWWGRKHFVCYLEIAGYADRTDEAAELMGTVLCGLEGGLALVSRSNLEGLRADSNELDEARRLLEEYDDGRRPQPHDIDRLPDVRPGDDDEG